MFKTLLTAATASLLLAGAAAAQTAQPAPAPADHSQHQAPAAAPAPAASARPTIDSPIEALVNNPQTKAVLDKHLPGVADHPAYDQFKAMTLRDVAPYSDGHITDALIAAIDADLKALPAS